MAVIETKNLNYVYSVGTPFVKAALNDVNISIEQGDFVAIIGHTGSGKSTLVQHFNGLVKPTSGQILVDGEDIWANPKDIKKLRFKVGLVFQYPEYQLFDETVEKDIAFGPKNMGLSDDEIKSRVKYAAEIVGLSDKLLSKSPFDLSGGEKRRAALAGVLAMRRKCIIFDESTAMLDPGGRKEVMDTICRLNREEGITVIHITHYMNEATMADRVLVMNEGSVIMDGTPSEVFSRADELWEAGLDVPQTTELLWKMKEAGYDVRLDIFEPEECAKEISRVLHGKS